MRLLLILHTGSGKKQILVDIPSPEQARILVNDATMMEKDEDLIKKSTKYKYDKIVEQQSKIAQLHNRKDGTVNKKQQSTLRQLYKLSQDIGKRLEADMSRELRGEPVVEMFICI